MSVLFSCLRGSILLSLLFLKMNILYFSLFLSLSLFLGLETGHLLPSFFLARRTGCIDDFFIAIYFV